jgi:hypothetical protein
VGPVTADIDAAVMRRLCLLGYLWSGTLEEIAVEVRLPATQVAAVLERLRVATLVLKVERAGEPARWRLL